jgi:hypothetical protein
LAWLGSTPIGGPVVGWVGQTAGARWALVIGGLATLLCGILVLSALTRIDRRTAAGADATPAKDPAAAGDAAAGRHHEPSLTRPADEHPAAVR